MKIKSKLILQAVFLALIPAVVIATIITLEANNATFDALEHEAQNRLVSLRELKKTQISDYFNTIDGQLLSMAKNPAVLDAAQRFITTFHQYQGSETPLQAKQLAQYYQRDFSQQFRRKDPEATPDVDAKLAQLDNYGRHFQSEYIANNKFPLGSKDQLVNAGQSSYDTVHQQYHKMFRDFLYQFGYYDIFIIDAKTGHVVYTVFKELDYATSLKSGPYANTGLAQAFNNALALAEGEHTSLVDFERYFPSYNAPASFISTPIRDDSGNTVAVLAFQMPVDGINNIMTNAQQWQQVGLGLSGETYLVGSDQKLRSESRFLLQDKANYLKALGKAGNQPNIGQIKSYNSAIGFQNVDTVGVGKALQGQSSFELYRDYRGVEVLSAYTPIEVGAQHWALMAEIDKDEAFAAAYQLSDKLYHYSLISLALIAVISILIGLYITHVLVSPISLLAERMQDISDGEGDLTVQLTLAERSDEIGDIGKAFNKFILHIRDVIVDINGHASQLSAASEELSAVTQETNKVVVLQKDKTDRTTMTMAEFNASISEIASNTEHTASLTARASAESAKGAEIAASSHDAINELVTLVNNAATELQRLEIQVADISSILGVIDSIAEQTNLLALNAAIEAARAGESGRGFAVVADEVRMLAGKTQESTVEIQSKIEALRHSSANSVLAMTTAAEQANHGITLVQSTSTSLATVTDLVANANAKNAENAAVASQQSASVGDVHGNIIEIAEYTEHTSSAFLQTAQASDELAKLAVNMSSIVQRFRF